VLPAIFISDVHLGCQHPRVVPQFEQKLCAMLRQWKGRASHIIFVGDTFEFWMEYQHYIGFAQWEFLQVLTELVQSGAKVHLLRGNHDFALGDFFPRYLGVEVHRDLHLEIQGKKLYFVHGDGMVASDWKYRLMRRVLDLPLNRFLFKLLHPDWGWALAQKVGGVSRQAGEGKECPWPEYQAQVKQLLRSKKVDMVVHGHTHIANYAVYPEGEHINCGNWLFDLNYIEFIDGTAHFKIFEE
jgi:UDP-2,3-diacylglucosamine hydrolase